MKAAVWFLLGLVLIVLLLFGRQIMPHVGAGNPLIRLCRFVGALLNVHYFNVLKQDLSHYDVMKL